VESASGSQFCSPRNKGAELCPALFVAGAISGGLVGGFLLGVQLSLASDLIVAIGCNGVAAALRRYVHAEQGFPRVVDVVWLLLIVGAGTSVVACVVVAAVTLASSTAGRAVPGDEVHHRRRVGRSRRA
jgi:putative Mn2+ efflux pump MntP